MEVIIGATILQAVGSVVGGLQEAQMQRQSARLMQKQLEAETANYSRGVAVENSAAATESLERTKKLRRVIGSTLSAGAYAGLSTDIGVINSINENSMFEAATEEGIARSNTEQRLASLRLDYETNRVNLNNSIAQARSSASSAIMKGFMGAAGAGASFFTWQQTLGKANPGAA